MIRLETKTGAEAPLAVLIPALLSFPVWPQEPGLASDKYRAPQGVQAPTPSPAQAQGGQTERKAFSQEQLEQLVAPIALYADALLAQTLMAATYPLEIVEAARWVQKHPDVHGDALEKALQAEDWEPAVKSLCGVPELLGRMNENLDWTKDLGDAFLADQAAVMDTVQRMRQKALEAGHLKTTDQQTVTEREDEIIVVESTDPDVVYVPTYYPTAVYGSWSYPYWYYPPLYPPYPPGYPAFTFAVGVVWGAAIWGGCHWGWGHSEIDIDIDHHNTFVSRTEVSDRRQDRMQRTGETKWEHRPEHRQNVAYRDAATAQRFGGTGVADRSARGYAATTRPAPGATPRPSTGSGGYGGSFSGSRSPGADRAASQRGSASRGVRPSRGTRGGGGRRR